MKPKVFIIIPTLGKGGAERVVSILANNLSSLNYNVSIILLNYIEREYELATSIRIVHLAKGKRTSSILSRLYFAGSTFLKFMSLVKKESPDYIISFTTNANIWTGIISNLCGVPYIVSERAVPDSTINSLNPLLKKVVFRLYKKSEALVVPSQGILMNLKKSQPFSKLDNVVIINNPVTEFQEFASRRVHEKKFILAVGRLKYVKGFDRLIEAFSKIKTSDVDLIILGEGSERRTLLNQIKSLELSHRVFLQGTKNNVQDYYNQCELFLLTSRNEGYPNVLIEAMSAGCASVAFDCEFGPSEIIEHGVNGLLIENNNTFLLAEAIDNILSSPTLKKSLSERAKEIGVSNSAQSITKKWEKLILNHA